MRRGEGLRIEVSYIPSVCISIFGATKFDGDVSHHKAAIEKIVFEVQWIFSKVELVEFDSFSY